MVSTSRDIIDGDTLLVETHVSSEGGVGHPFGGCPGSGLLEHLVDLFEGETLGFGDEKEGEEEGEDAERAPHEEDLGAEVGIAGVGADEVGGDDGDDAVPEPVGSGGETNTTRSDGQREDLTDHDPGGGTPGHGESGDEEADEGNHGGDSGVVVLVGSSSSDTNDTDDELADNHPSGTPDENGTTTELLNDVEGHGSGADVDESGDQGDEERVGNRSEGGEEDGSEVEDEVDTSELLHHLEENTNSGTAGVADTSEDGALEAVEPATDVASLGNDLLLVLVVGNDFSKFVLDEFGLDGLATDARQSNSGLFESTLLDVETRGFGEEKQTASEDDGPQELDGNRDTVGTAVVTVLCGIHDAVGKQDTNGDAELVSGDERTTNLSGRDLRHIQDNDGRDVSNTETSDQTTSNHQSKTGGSGLENAADGEDQATQDDGGSATDEVSHITGHDGTEEGTAGENGGDQGLVAGGKMEVLGVGGAGSVGCATGSAAIGIQIAGILEIGILTDEVLHGEDTSRPTGVITKEDTTKGGKGAHEVGLQSHGRLNTGGIRGTTDGNGGNSSTRHDCGVVLML